MFTISDTPPASPSVGQGWWDSSTGQGYIWYTDANSSQWVVFNDQGPQGGPGPQGVAGPQGPTGAGTGFNKLINGFLEIDQANEGSAPNIVPSSYIVDGFVGSMASGNSFAASGQRFSSGGPTGYPYGLVLSVSAGATVVAAGAAYQLYSNIEADELYDTQMGTTQAQPLTASFWAQASIAQTYYFSLRTATGTRSYVAPFTLTSANTWQFFSITIPGDTSAGWTTSGNTAGMTVSWCIGAGTNFQAPVANIWSAGNYIGLTGMSNSLVTTAGSVFRLGPCKLELGSVATPLRRESFQRELTRCQRYYEKSYDPGIVPGTASVQTGVSLFLLYGVAGAATVGTTIPFSVTKRASPTLTAYSSVTGAAGKARDAATNVDMPCTPSANSRSCYWTANLNTPGTTNLQLQWVADARL